MSPTRTGTQALPAPRRTPLERSADATAPRLSAPSPGPRRPAPAPARPRHLELVRGRPAPGRRPPVAFLALAAAGTFAALFAVVTVNIVLQGTTVERVSLERRVAEQRRSLEQLELEAERLRSPARIRSHALEIGLIDPAEVVVLSPVRDRSPSPTGGRD